MSKKLAKAAYAVYLIHSLVVISLVSIYIQVYNYVNEIDISSDDRSIGDSEFAVGIICVTFLSNLIVWPLGYRLRKLNILKGFL